MEELEYCYECGTLMLYDIEWGVPMTEYDEVPWHHWECLKCGAERSERMCC